MNGAPIRMIDGNLEVPDEPIIHYIEGDGIGIDITPVMQRVVDGAVERAYGGRKRIHWSEVLAGQKAYDQVGEWLPEATLDAMRSGLVSIKGPLTTPVGGGIRSLNVALRQKLDLFACVRPVRWYSGTPSPVRDPGAVDMVIFRENSEDVYAGIEWEAGTEGADQVIAFLQASMGVDKIRFPETSNIGIKPISREGTERIVRANTQPCTRARLRERHAGAQGEHHEIHRRRVQGLGIRARQEGIRSHGTRWWPMVRDAWS